MRIEHKTSGESIKALNPLQKFCLVLAVTLAFAGIFVWLFKILFF